MARTEGGWIRLDAYYSCITWHLSPLASKKPVSNIASAIAHPALDHLPTEPLFNHSLLDSSRPGAIRSPFSVQRVGAFGIILVRVCLNIISPHFCPISPSLQPLTIVASGLSLILFVSGENSPLLSFITSSICLCSRFWDL